ncbi:MAG: dTDP-4-dehydrorhamnose 3,5-epimerase [Flavobacteriia bacterium]|nr:MAG: dTDP-4-dehydrorhamnose 3,5-epimerase [Flavobacteriia bacterium]
MQIQPTPIPGLLLIEPRVFGDKRGYFMETYSSGPLAEQGLFAHFVQDNESLSQKGVLRGLHWQAPPFAQGKLVRVVSGAVFDAVVDIRVGSPTYGRPFGLRLDGENKRMLYIPPGFAHGFATLEDDTRFLYKCTGPYNKESEGCIHVNDPALGIDWGIDEPILSEKDAAAPLLADIQSPFSYAG